MPRCSYVEHRRRCSRSGVGDPPFCSAHRIVVNEAAGAPTRNPHEAFTDLVDHVMQGGELTMDDVIGATRDMLGWAMGGGIAQGYYPDISHEQPHQQGPGRWYDPLFQNQQRQREAPPPDPGPFVSDEDIRRARVTLGFAAGEPLTKEQIQKRHRELAKRHHPDRGGKLETMQEINAAVDVLMEHAV